MFKKLSVKLLLLFRNEVGCLGLGNNSNSYLPALNSYLMLGHNHLAPRGAQEGDKAKLMKKVLFPQGWGQSP